MIRFRRNTVDALIHDQDISGLLQCLKDNDPVVQLKAAAGLAQLGQYQGYDFLVTCLGQPDPSIRCAAIEALGDLRDPHAVEALIPLLKDHDQEVRETAIAALKRINTYDAMQALDAYQQLKSGLQSEEQLPGRTDSWSDTPHPILGAIPGWDANSSGTAPADEQKAAEELFILADHHQEESLTMQAFNECSRAITLAPAWADPYNLKGILLEDLGKPFPAMLAYQRAIKLDPTLTAASDNLHDLLRDLQVLSEPQTGDWQDRCDAIASLNQRPEPEAVEVIASLLNDEEPEVVAVALDALLASSFKEASQALEVYFNSFQVDAMGGE